MRDYENSTTPSTNGKARRDVALTNLEKARAHYIHLGRLALLEALLAFGNGTADDVRSLVKLPPGISPKLFGSVPSLLVKNGIIVPDGYRPSARPEAHARPVQIWKLADREAARRWLQQHPKVPATAPVVAPRDIQRSFFDATATSTTEGGL